MEDIDLIQRCFKVHHSNLDSFLKVLNNFGTPSDRVRASDIFMRSASKLISEDYYEVVVDVRSKYNGPYIVERIQEELKELWDEAVREP